jgi:hypothetical protein
MSAILPKLEPADVTVKREMDDILEDNEVTSQSPAAKRVKAGRKPPHAPEDGEQTSHTTPADSPKGRKTTGTAQTPSPSKATTTNGAPGGLIPEDKAAMTEELIAAGLSAIGVRNIAAKVSFPPGVLVQDVLPGPRSSGLRD